MGDLFPVYISHRGDSSGKKNIESEGKGKVYVGENLVRKQSASRDPLKCGLPTPHSLRSALDGVFHGEY